MRLKSTDPGGRKKSGASWSHEKLKGGGSFSGWKAGPCFWCWVHFLGQSKPCRKELLGEGVDCPHCFRRPRVDEIGYCPIYAESGKPLVVIVQDYSRDVIDAIKPGEAVKVFRGTEKGDEIRVSPFPGKASYRPTSERRLDAADIRCWLLTLWAEPDLTRLCLETEDDPVREALKKASTAHRESLEATRQLAKRIEGTMRVRGGAGAAGREEPVALGDVIPYVAPPGRNGVHKPE